MVCTSRVRTSTERSCHTDKNIILCRYLRYVRCADGVRREAVAPTALRRHLAVVGPGRKHHQPSATVARGRGGQRAGDRLWGGPWRGAAVETRWFRRGYLRQIELPGFGAAGEGSGVGQEKVLIVATSLVSNTATYL